MAAPDDKPLVLAVDDDLDLLALMARVLSAGYAVKTAADAAGALLVAAARPQPDLVLLDVELKGMSGFDVCKALKANPDTAYIPVRFPQPRAPQGVKRTRPIVDLRAHTVTRPGAVRAQDFRPRDA